MSPSRETGRGSPFLGVGKLGLGGPLRLSRGVGGPASPSAPCGLGLPASILASSPPAQAPPARGADSAAPPPPAGRLPQGMGRPPGHRPAEIPGRFPGSLRPACRVARSLLRLRHLRPRRAPIAGTSPSVEPLPGNVEGLFFFGFASSGFARTRPRGRRGGDRNGLRRGGACSWRRLHGVRFSRSPG